MTLLLRVEPAKRVNRWYSIAVEPTLFDALCVVLRWGSRRTRYARVRVLVVESQAQAEEIANAITAKKKRRGYRHPSARAQKTNADP